MTNFDYKKIMRQNHQYETVKVIASHDLHFHLRTTTASNDAEKFTKMIEVIPVLSKMHQNSAISNSHTSSTPTRLVMAECHQK